MRIHAASIPALTILLAIAGCAAESETPSSEISVHEVRGSFVRPAFEGEAMRVDHEEIPGVMPAMTMDFRLAEPAEIDGLQEGDRLVFEYVIGDGMPYARGVRRLESPPVDGD